MPGLIFSIDHGDLKSHESMGLPAVTQLDPPLMQGANPEESRTNLYNWIDLVAKRYLPPRAFVQSCSGEIQKGMYHQLKSSELERFIGELSIRLQDWGAQCIANQTSCGSAVQADGSGAGKVTMTPIILGPFRGC